MRADDATGSPGGLRQRLKRETAPAHRLAGYGRHTGAMFARLCAVLERLEPEAGDEVSHWAGTTFAALAAWHGARAAAT